MNRLLLLAAAAVSATALAAAPLAYTYSYNTAPDVGYPDSGSELNNGQTYSVAWDGVHSITYDDVAGLVGWANSNPIITLHFASPVNVTSVVAWFADSNGAAAVAMPVSVTLSDSAGFSSFFSVTDPDGAGSTAPVLLDGFSVVTDTLTLNAGRVTLPGYVWTMLSEVQIFGTAAVPEPASFTALAGFAALGGALVRRRRPSAR